MKWSDESRERERRWEGCERKEEEDGWISQDEEGEEVQGGKGEGWGGGYAANSFAELRHLEVTVMSPEQQRFDFLNHSLSWGAGVTGRLERHQEARRRKSDSLYVSFRPRAVLFKIRHDLAIFFLILFRWLEVLVPQMKRIFGLSQTFLRSVCPKKLAMTLFEKSKPVAGRESVATVHLIVFSATTLVLF